MSNRLHVYHQQPLFHQLVQLQYQHHPGMPQPIEHGNRPPPLLPPDRRYPDSPFPYRYPGQGLPQGYLIGQGAGYHTGEIQLSPSPYSEHQFRQIPTGKGDNSNQTPSGKGYYPGGATPTQIGEQCEEGKGKASPYKDAKKNQGPKVDQKPTQEKKKFYLCVNGIDPEQNTDTLFNYMESCSQGKIIKDKSLRTEEEPKHAVLVFEDRIEIKDIKTACKDKKLGNSNLEFEELDPPKSIMASSDDDRFTEDAFKDYLSNKKKLDISRATTRDDGTIYAKLKSESGVSEILKDPNPKISDCKVTISEMYNCSHGTYWNESLLSVSIPRRIKAPVWDNDIKSFLKLVKIQSVCNKQLEQHHARLIMMGELPHIQCTISPQDENARQKVKGWKASAQKAFGEFMKSGAKKKELNIRREIKDSLMEHVNKTKQNHNSEELYVISPEESGNMKIVFIGRATVVENFYDQVSAKKTEIEELQKVKKKMKTDSFKVKPLELALMRKLNKLEKLEDMAPSFSFKVDENTGNISLEGIADDIVKAKVILFEGKKDILPYWKIDTLSSNQCKLLQKNDVIDLVHSEFASKNIPIEFSVQSHSVDVCTEHIDQREIENVFKGVVLEKSFALDEGSKVILTQNEWADKKNDLINMFQNVSIIDDSLDVIVATATGSAFDIIVGEIDTFVKEHSIFTDKITISQDAVYRFLKQHCKDQIKDLEFRNSYQKLKIDFEANPVKISGTKLAIQNAKQEIQQMESQIDKQSHHVSKPGIDSLFSDSTKAQRLISPVEEESETIMILGQNIYRCNTFKRQSGPKQSDDAYVNDQAFKNYRRDMKLKKHVTLAASGPVVFKNKTTVTLVKKEDLAKQGADVIVCSTNCSLDLSGQAGKHIRNGAGRQILEDITTNYKRGINLGDIAVVNGYNLKCKKVYLAALPTWSPGGEKFIAQSINQSLTQAANYNSIVFSALGTGNFQYPRDLVAKTMYDCVSKFDQKNSSLKDIKFLCYDPETIRVFEQEELKRTNQGHAPLPSEGTAPVKKSNMTEKQVEWEFGTPQEEMDPFGRKYCLGNTTRIVKDYQEAGKMKLNPANGDTRKHSKGQPPKDYEHIHDVKTLIEGFPHPNVRTNPSDTLPVGSGDVWNRMTDWNQLTVAEQTSVRAFLLEKFSVEDLELAYDEYYPRFGEREIKSDGSSTSPLTSNEACITLIGKTGAGKSSLGNSLLGQNRKTKEVITIKKHFIMLENCLSKELKRIIENFDMANRWNFCQIRNDSRIEEDAKVSEIMKMLKALHLDSKTIEIAVKRNEIQSKTEFFPYVFFQDIKPVNIMTADSERTEIFLENGVQHKKWVSEEKELRWLQKESELTDNITQNFENVKRHTNKQDHNERAQNGSDSAESSKDDKDDKTTIPVEKDFRKRISTESESFEKFEGENKKENEAEKLPRGNGRQDQKVDREKQGTFVTDECDPVERSSVNPGFSPLSRPLDFPRRSNANPVFSRPFGFHSVAIVILMIIVSISCENLQTENGTTVHPQRKYFLHHCVHDSLKLFDVEHDFYMHEKELIDECNDVYDMYEIKINIEAFSSETIIVPMKFYRVYWYGEEILFDVTGRKMENQENTLYRIPKETNTETRIPMSAWDYPVIMNVPEGPLINLEDLKALSYGRRNGMKAMKNKRKETTGYLDVGTAMYAYVAICVFLASVFTTVAEIALVEMPMMFLRKELFALFCMALSLFCLYCLIQNLKECKTTLEQKETFCFRWMAVFDISACSFIAMNEKAIQLKYHKDPPVKVLADTIFLMYFVLTTLWTLYFIFCSIYNYLPHAKELSLQWGTCAAKVIYGKCMQAQLIFKKCFRTALDVKEIISRKIMCLRAMLIGIMIFVGKAAHLFSMTWEIIRMINKTGMKEALECLNSQHTEERHEKKEKDLSDEPVVEAVHKNHMHDADKTKYQEEINVDNVLGEPRHAVEVNEMSFNKDVDLEQQMPQIDHVDSENKNQNTDGSHKPNKGTKVLEDEAVENALLYSTNKMEAVKEVHAFDATALIDIRADVNIKTSEVNSNRSCQNKATENEMTSCIDGNEAEYNPKNGDVESINMIQIQRSGTDTFSDNVPHVFISFDTEPVRSLIPQEAEKYPTSQYLDQIVNGNKSIAERGEIVGKNEEFKCRSENLLNPDAPAVSIISMKRQSSVGLIDENETSVKFTENHHSVNDISLDKHDFDDDDDDDEVFLDDHAINTPSGGIQQCTEPSEYNSFVFTRTCEVGNSAESLKGDVNVEKHIDKVWQIPDYTLVPGHMEVVSDESFLKSTSSNDSEESLKKTSRDLSSSFAPSFCSLKNDQEYVVGQVHSITSGNIGNDSRKHALSCNENENNNNVNIEHTKISKGSIHTYNVGTEQTLYCNPDNKLLSINPTSEGDSLSSSTVIDLQKKQERKIEEICCEKIDEKKEETKVLEAAMIESKKVYVKETVERNVGNCNNNKTNAKKSAGSFTATRRRKVKRISRRRLRQIITPTHEWFTRVSNDTLSRCTGPAIDGNTVVNNRNGQLPVTNRTNNQVNNNQNLTQTETVQEPRTNDDDLSFNGYFNKVVGGYNFEQQERMQFEMLRIQSFQDLPASCPASPLKMVKTGFYSSGRGDEVICFSCGVHYKNWQQKDIPTLIHKQISPGCKMVLGTETRNIPIERETNGLHRQPEPMSNGFAPSTIQQDGGSITQPNTRLMMENNVVSQQDISRSNVADELPQSLPQPSPMTPFSSKPPVTDCAEQLGIVLERPKYPAYAQLNIRVSTFQGWPGYLDQSPRDMALAGFFYAGYNDYCRCFYCGGGLRNWDAGDDPWVEHARWFPRCAFIIQNRGKRFVEIIEKRQAEMESSGQAGQTIDRKTMASADTTENAPQPSTQSLAATQTLTSFANQDDGTERAVQAVVDMGYSEAVVRRAVDAFKTENPGKTVDAALVFEIVFTLPDESSATNFTVTSETREPQNNIARSNKQASTQSTGAKKDKKKSPGSQKQAAKQSSNSSESSLPSLSVNSLEHGNATGDQAQAASFKEISESEIRSLQEENLQLKEQVMCKICMDKNVSIAFLPCGHLACCIDCAPAMRKCPMCRVFIKGTVKTYLA